MTIHNLNRISGIYAVIHRASGMIYVGSSVNVGVRFNAHCGAARRGSGNRFHRALRELGETAFDFELLEECDKSKLLERERFYIVLMDATHVDNLNVKDSPFALYGVIPDAATRERQRAAKLGKRLTPEHCLKLRTAPRKKKRNLSDEHKARLSESHKTSPKCLAIIAAMHKAQVGLKHSAEYIEKRIAPLRGRNRDAATVAKIAAANKGKIMSPEARANMSAGWAARRARLSKQTLLAV